MTFTTASTSSSFCSVGQGIFSIIFWACSAWKRGDVFYQFFFALLCPGQDQEYFYVCPSFLRTGSIYAAKLVTLSLTGLWLCLFHNEFCVGRVIESDQRRPAKPLFLPDNEAAVFQLPEYPCDALPAAMQSFLCLFHREIQADRPVRLYVTVLSGNTCPAQQERIKHLGIVGDALLHLILQKKTGRGM